MTESWLNAPWIETYQDYDYNDEPINLSDLAWFDVKISLVESDIEKKENIEAMQQQVKLGILQSNGLPVGMHVPESAVNAFNNSRRLTPAFKMPTATNKHFSPIGVAPTQPIKNIFQQARNNMSRLDELTRDRRKA
jgi:hypothetical protein